MCAGMLVHIARHQDRTSNNNNKRRQPWICGIPCYACLYRFLHRIFGFMTIIILTAHTLLYPLYPPASCLLSYHAQSTVRLYVIGLWWHKIKVYRWGFPCLDYSFDVLVSWSRNLRLYDEFCSYSALFNFISFISFMLVQEISSVVLSILLLVSLSAPVCMC